MYLSHNSMNCKEGTNVECGIQERSYGEREASKSPMKDSDAWKTSSVRAKLNWFLLLDM